MITCSILRGLLSSAAGTSDLAIVGTGNHPMPIGCRSFVDRLENSVPADHPPKLHCLMRTEFSSFCLEKIEKQKYSRQKWEVGDSSRSMYMVELKLLAGRSRLEHMHFPQTQLNQIQPCHKLA